MKMHEWYVLRMLDDDGLCILLSENHKIYAGDQLQPYVVPRLKIKYQIKYIKCEARREQTVRPDQLPAQLVLKCPKCICPTRLYRWNVDRFIYFRRLCVFVNAKEKLNFQNYLCIPGGCGGFSVAIFFNKKQKFHKTSNYSKKTFNIELRFVPLDMVGHSKLIFVRG